MATEGNQERTNSARVMIISLMGLIIALALILVSLIVTRSTVAEVTANERVNVLADSNDDCVVCHSRTTPGIVDQYGHSTMAAAEVSCQDCHEVTADYPGAIPHEGTHVLNQPTTAMCETCHQAEVAQFLQSRHALPAYVAYAGTDALSTELRAVYDAIPEAEFQPDRSRNALYHLEGPAITRFACEGCHNIGAPAADGSVGECSECHIRHEFSLEQVRKPETCNACHIGPDHPQWEIYQESAHGIMYATTGDDWNWEAEPGTLGPTDFPAATCATCHMSGFGASATTHDVGDRLTWYLFSPISERRPNYQENRTEMQQVCHECHNVNFIDELYADGDALVVRINELVEESNAIIQPLKDNNLLTAEPFDEPIDFVYFDIWHHWGRTAKFGAWMQGPDYTQWHGAYEMLRDTAELEEMVHDKLEEAGIEPPGEE